MRKIYSTVCRIMGQFLALHPEEITPDTPSPGKYQDKAAAAIACEKTFHIEMEDERIGGFKTVADWVEYVSERISDQDDRYVPPTDEEREKWYYH